MAIWKRTDNWLAGIASANHPNHSITELNGLTVAQAQAAFDTTYGKGRFRVRDHGTVITVFSNPAMVDKLKLGLARATERNDAEYVTWYQGRIAEYQAKCDGKVEDDT